VFNRTVTLRDTWARIEQGDVASSGRPERPRPAAGDGKARPRRASAPRASDAEEPSAELLAARVRYRDELSLSEEDAKLLTRDADTAALFDAAIVAGAPARSVANWMINELPRELRERALSELPFGGAGLGALVAMVEDGTITGSVARDVLAEMAESGGDPAAIVERKGLRQISDPDALRPAVTAVIAEFPDRVSAYHGGRTGLLGFFVGQVMSRSGGRANPELVKQLVADALGQP
jgi:glutaminyl-tRNA synthetase